MLSANVKKLCAEHEISVFALENATGVANGSVGRWDKKPPKIYNLKRVADFFGVSVDSLLEGVDDPRFRPKPRTPQT